LPHDAPARSAEGQALPEAGVIPLDFGQSAQLDIQQLQQLLVEAARGRLAADAIVHPATATACLNQAGGPHQAKVPGHLVLGHLEGIRQLAHAQLLPLHEAQESESRRIRQYGEQAQDFFHE
jgi:hypothetical protein